MIGKNMHYTTAGGNGPTWHLWQKAPGQTRGRPLRFWRWGCRGSKASYTPTEKEILAAYEGGRAASEVVGTEAQLPFAPWLLMKSKCPRAVAGDKVPAVHLKNMLGQPVWVSPATGKGQPSCGIAFAQGPGCIWWVMWQDGEVQCVPQRNVILGENSQQFKLYDVNCDRILHVVTSISCCMLYQ